MKKLVRLFVSVCVLAGLFMISLTLADKQTLKNDLIRLHVVANSDSAKDQDIKLRVRDAVLTWVKEYAPQTSDADGVRKFLVQNLEELEAVANAALAEWGSNHKAVVTLGKEAFPIREYDTFSLPSGVYESLRVSIGAAEGKNWWCVVFPALCAGATTDAFTDTAVGAGFSDRLTDTLTGEHGYEVSFFFLDCLGKLENFFHLR